MEETTSMRVAIIEYYPSHSEIIACFVQHLFSLGYTVDAYAPSVDTQSFLPFYKQVLTEPFNVFDINEFTAKRWTYRYVILNTCETQTACVLSMIRPWFICIHHTNYHLNVLPQLAWNFAMSPLLYSNLSPTRQLQYVLPIHQHPNVSEVEPRTFGSTVRLLLVGLTAYYHKDMNDLDKVLTEFASSDFNVTIITRDVCVKRQLDMWRDRDKVDLHVNVTAKELIDNVLKCDYILTLERKGGYYVTDRLSGSVPLGLTYKRPLISSMSMHSIYGYPQTEITYQDSLCEVMPAILNMKPDRYRAIVDRQSEYAELIHQRNKHRIEQVMREYVASTPEIKLQR